jgi:hypothetical protein
MASTTVSLAAFALLFPVVLFVDTMAIPDSVNMIATTVTNSTIELPSCLRCEFRAIT